MNVVSTITNENRSLAISSAEKLRVPSELMTCLTKDKKKINNERVRLVCLNGDKDETSTDAVNILPSLASAHWKSCSRENNCLKMSDIRANVSSLVFISLFRNGENSRGTHFGNEGWRNRHLFRTSVWAGVLALRMTSRPPCWCLQTTKQRPYCSP